MQDLDLGAGTARYEVIDAATLAERWKLPESWIRSQTRERTPRDKQIPHLRLGKYVRFFWGSPELDAYLRAHLCGFKGK